MLSGKSYKKFKCDSITCIGALTSKDCNSKHSISTLQVGEWRETLRLVIFINKDIKFCYLFLFKRIFIIYLKKFTNKTSRGSEY